MRKPIRYISGVNLFLLLFTSLVGCAIPQRTLPPVAEKMPVKETIEMKEQPLEPAPCNGSLYEARSSFNGFFIDTKARKIGDIVTVKISESSEATNSADTQTGRTSSLEAGIETLFGIEDWYEDQVLDQIPSKIEMCRLFPQRRLLFE